MPKPLAKNWPLVAVLLIGYLFTGYFIFRTDTILILSLFSLFFGIYFWIYSTTEDSSIKQWVTLGITLRIILLFSVPNLSDDVYRFLWDGHLLANGIHPFSNVPEFFNTNNILPSVLNQELLSKLNSPDRFTIYPPVAQGVFWVAAKIASDNILIGIVVIRLFIILSEIGSIFLLKKLLSAFQLPAKNILLYALNPLVILEFSGNMHLEALMIFFLLLTIYLLHQKRRLYSALAFAFAICSKLIPLIFLPVLLLSFKSLKKAVYYGLVVMAGCLLLFIPLLEWDIVSGFIQSFGYYFTYFEFNASVYYLVREWGLWYYGYNIIQTAGWKLGLISGVSILVYTFIKSYIRNKEQASYQHLPEDWLWIYGIYLLFTTTLHPWYAIPMLAFSIFTTYRFTVLWTFLIFFTYSGYTATGYTENLWIVFIEYMCVILYLVYEFNSSRIQTVEIKG